MRLAPFLLVALMACHGKAAAGEPPTVLGDVLPQGTYRAEVQRFGLPRELAGVQARFVEAVRTKNDWFQAYVGRQGGLKPGEPLPYHPEMGITRDEYEALLKAYQHPVLVPTGSFELVIEATATSLRFRAPPPYQFLNDLTLDGSGALHGPRGLDVRPARVTGRSATFGIWSGTSWSLETGDVRQGDHRLFDLAVGRLAGSEQLFVYVQNVLVERKQSVSNDQLLVWLSTGGVH